MTLQDLEKLARKNSTASTMIDGQEFEVYTITKSRHRRFSYRHGQRHMGRDEAERLLPAAMTNRNVLASPNDYNIATDLLRLWIGRGYDCEIVPLTLRSQVIYEIVELELGAQ